MSLSFSSPRQLDCAIHSKKLEVIDPAVFNVLRWEQERQQQQLVLTAPQSSASSTVRQVFGSGYAGATFCPGELGVSQPLVEFVTNLEALAIERARALFRANSVCVRPKSGVHANIAVYLAVLRPGDIVLSMRRTVGGYYRRANDPDPMGKWFKSAYFRTTVDGHIDYAHLEELALARRPKLIVVGDTCYDRAIDFERVGDIARAVDAKVLADVSQMASLIVSSCYPDPMPHVDFVTTSTNDSLGGLEGGVILVSDPDNKALLRSAEFTYPSRDEHLEMTAAKAVCFREALKPAFRNHARATLENARTIAATIVSRGQHVVTDGTDTASFTIDLRSRRLTGKKVQDALASVGIITRRTLVPYDPEKPKHASGIRIASPIITERGMRSAECKSIGNLIADVLDRLVRGERNFNTVSGDVDELVRRFPNPRK